MRAASQALNIVQSRQFTLVSKTITFEMRSKMIDKLGRISIRQYETKGSGGINAHLITDIETIDQFVGSTLAKFVISFFDRHRHRYRSALARLASGLIYSARKPYCHLFLSQTWQYGQASQA